jgi:PilZ domain
MDDDRRGDYRLLLPGAEVVYRAAPARPEDRRYLVGVAENLSLGGLFISTRHPFPVGTLVYLDLYPGHGDDRSPFSARALVRWRQRWLAPRGMGLQFVDFNHLDDRSVAGLLERALTAPPAWRRPAGCDPKLS